MKFNKIASVFFSICAFLLFSCNNLTEKENLSDDGERLATLKISLADSSRTVLPHLGNLEDLTDFEFYGIISKNDYYKNLEYNSSSYYQYRNYYSSFSDLQNAEINLDVGEWTFTLTAKKDGSTYKGTKTQNIVQGENTISFELELIDSGVGKGSFSLTLDFSEAENADKVTSAKAVLQNINGTSVDGFETRNLSISDGKVCYSGNTLPVGSYRALITLYSGDLDLLTWREIVVIASDLVSEAERKLDSLNLYTVTYVMNDDDNTMANFADSALEKYNRHSTIMMLPQVTRDYYDFVGWHLKDDLSDDVITELPADVCGDVTVYAEWKLHNWPIIYNLNGGTFESEYKSEYNYSDKIELSVPVRNDYNFDGWFSDENFSGEAIAEIEEKSSGDKEFYAKWNPIEHTITYILDGGVFLTESPKTYKEQIDLKYTIPYKAGKTFKGWYNSSNKKIGIIIGLDYGDITLYARWNSPAEGDVVLSDGRIITTDSYDISNMEAIAILFTFDDKWYGAGIYNSYGDGKTYSWCTENAVLYADEASEISVQAANYSGLLNGAIDRFYGDLDGSDNWDYICSKDSNSDNYPAFSYACNYGNTINSEYYKNGWYIPSGYELRQIYLKLSKINASLEVIGGNKIIGEYWSSNTLSQLSYGGSGYTMENTASFSMLMSSGSCYKDNTNKAHYQKYVCVIRKFSWE